jgi:F-type H+-transporting ATPase subunit b
MEFNDEFFVATGFVIFIAGLAYLGVHGKISRALDHRADRIRAQLAEAEHLRAEAAAVLASFEQKKIAAEAEAAAIVAQARAEAERIAAEAHTRMADFIKRRTRQAEEKITTAEAQATAQVRAVAADAAVKAAEIVLRQQSKGAFGDELVTRAVGDLKHLAH